MTNNWNAQLNELQKKTEYYFNDNRLLQTALTHSSFVNEANLKIAHNERLEFLGDSVVALYVSQELFKRFPANREGELTHMRAKLVSGNALGERALEIGLDKYLRLGRGEEHQGGRSRIALLANAFEAFVGAVFLDGGYEAARAVLEKICERVWDSLACSERSKDNKSLLQELMQQEFKVRPQYDLINADGPEHKKKFQVAVTLPNGDVLQATGSTLKQAEQIAAGLALEHYLAENSSHAIKNG